MQRKDIAKYFIQYIDTMSYIQCKYYTYVWFYCVKNCHNLFYLYIFIMKSCSKKEIHKDHFLLTI